MLYFLPLARMREAGLSNRFCPQVRQFVSVSSKFWADHDNEGSKRHSNNDNIEKTVHGVPEGG